MIYETIPACTGTEYVPHVGFVNPPFAPSSYSFKKTDFMGYFGKFAVFLAALKARKVVHEGFDLAALAEGHLATVSARSPSGGLGLSE